MEVTLSGVIKYLLSLEALIYTLSFSFLRIIV
jgi:hypothetical protein